MSDICFIDTETLGLHPDAPVWEFAAVRRFHADPVLDGQETSLHCTIRHEPAHWLYDFPEQFAADYRSRYNAKRALEESDAAAAIYLITKSAHIVGAVPSFDTDRLAKLLRRNGIEPDWHYHLIDIENVVVGYTRGLYAASGQEMPILPPYDSNELSEAVGVDPAMFEQHTALGDVLWVRAQWDAVMGNEVRQR